MLKKRLILCLLLRNGIFQNSRNFALQNIGELDWIMQYLNFEAIDELVVLNVERGEMNLEKFAAQLCELSRFCFVPMVAGGGVRTLDHFATLLKSGADKIAINSVIFDDPDFVTRAAEVYGTQCVVASIDCRYVDGAYIAFSHNGSRNTGREVIELAKTVEFLGAGEIFLTSIDRDGVGQGYDLDLVRAVVEAVSIPVIASGGVGHFRHLVEGVTEGQASAVSAANIFHFIGEGLIKAKQYMANSGLNVPMWNFY